MLFRSYTQQLALFGKRNGASHPNELQQLNDELKKMKEEVPRLDQIHEELLKTITDFKSATANNEKIYSCSEDWSIVSTCNSALSKSQGELNAIQGRINASVTHMQSVIDSLKQ